MEAVLKNWIPLILDPHYVVSVNDINEIDKRKTFIGFSHIGDEGPKKEKLSKMIDLRLFPTDFSDNERRTIFIYLSTGVSSFPSGTTDLPENSDLKFRWLKRSIYEKDLGTATSTSLKESEKLKIISPDPRFKSSLVIRNTFDNLDSSYELQTLVLDSEGEPSYWKSVCAYFLINKFQINDNVTEKQDETSLRGNNSFVECALSPKKSSMDKLKSSIEDRSAFKKKNATFSMLNCLLYSMRESTENPKTISEILEEVAKRNEPVQKSLLKFFGASSLDSDLFVSRDVFHHYSEFSKDETFGSEDADDVASLALGDYFPKHVSVASPGDVRKSIDEGIFSKLVRSIRSCDSSKMVRKTETDSVVTLCLKILIAMKSKSSEGVSKHLDSKDEPKVFSALVLFLHLFPLILDSLMNFRIYETFFDKMNDLYGIVDVDDNSPSESDFSIFFKREILFTRAIDDSYYADSSRSDILPSSASLVIVTKFVSNDALVVRYPSFTNSPLISPKERFVKENTVFGPFDLISPEEVSRVLIADGIDLDEFSYGGNKCWKWCKNDAPLSSISGGRRVLNLSEDFVSSYLVEIEPDDYNDGAVYDLWLVSDLFLNTSLSGECRFVTKQLVVSLVVRTPLSKVQEVAVGNVRRFSNKNDSSDVVSFELSLKRNQILFDIVETELNDATAYSRLSGVRFPVVKNKKYAEFDERGTEIKEYALAKRVQGFESSKLYSAVVGTAMQKKLMSSRGFDGIFKALKTIPIEQILSTLLDKKFWDDLEESFERSKIFEQHGYEPNDSMLDFSSKLDERTSMKTTFDLITSFSKRRGKFKFLSDGTKFKFYDAVVIKMILDKFLNETSYEETKGLGFFVVNAFADFVYFDALTKEMEKDLSFPNERKSYKMTSEKRKGLLQICVDEHAPCLSSAWNNNVLMQWSKLKKEKGREREEEIEKTNLIRSFCALHRRKVTDALVKLVRLNCESWIADVESLSEISKDRSEPYPLVPVKTETKKNSGQTSTSEEGSDEETEELIPFLKNLLNSDEYEELVKRQMSHLRYFLYDRAEDRENFIDEEKISLSLLSSGGEENSSRFNDVLAENIQKLLDFDEKGSELIVNLLKIQNNDRKTFLRNAAKSIWTEKTNIRKSATILIPILKLQELENKKLDLLLQEMDEKSDRLYEEIKGFESNLNAKMRSSSNDDPISVLIPPSEEDHESNRVFSENIEREKLRVPVESFDMTLNLLQGFLGENVNLLRSYDDSLKEKIRIEEEKKRTEETETTKEGSVKKEPSEGTKDDFNKYVRDLVSQLDKKNELLEKTTKEMEELNETVKDMREKMKEIELAARGPELRNSEESEKEKKEREEETVRLKEKLTLFENRISELEEKERKQIESVDEMQENLKKRIEELTSINEVEKLQGDEKEERMKEEMEKLKSIIEGEKIENQKKIQEIEDKHQKDLEETRQLLNAALQENEKTKKEKDDQIERAEKLREELEKRKREQEREEKEVSSKEGEESGSPMKRAAPFGVVLRSSSSSRSPGASPLKKTSQGKERTWEPLPPESDVNEIAEFAMNVIGDVPDPHPIKEAAVSEKTETRNNHPMYVETRRAIEEMQSKGSKHDLNRNELDVLKSYVHYLYLYWKLLRPLSKITNEGAENEKDMIAMLRYVVDNAMPIFCKSTTMFLAKAIQSGYGSRSDLKGSTATEKYRNVTKGLVSVISNYLAMKYVTDVGVCFGYDRSFFWFPDSLQEMIVNFEKSQNHDVKEKFFSSLFEKKAPSEEKEPSALDFVKTRTKSFIESRETCRKILDGTTNVPCRIAPFFMMFYETFHLNWTLNKFASACLKKSFAMAGMPGAVEGSVLTNLIYTKKLLTSLKVVKDPYYEEGFLVDVHPYGTDKATRKTVPFYLKNAISQTEAANPDAGFISKLSKTYGSLWGQLERRSSDPFGIVSSFNEACSSVEKEFIGALQAGARDGENNVNNSKTVYNKVTETQVQKPNRKAGEDDVNCAFALLSTKEKMKGFMFVSSRIDPWTFSISNYDNETFSASKILINNKTSCFLNQKGEIVRFYANGEFGAKINPNSDVGKIVSAMDKEIVIPVSLAFEISPIYGQIFDVNKWKNRLPIKSFFIGPRAEGFDSYESFSLPSDKTREVEKIKRVDVLGNERHDVYKLLSEVDPEWVSRKDVLPKAFTISKIVRVLKIDGSTGKPFDEETNEWGATAWIATKKRKQAENLKDLAKDVMSDCYEGNKADKIADGCVIRMFLNEMEARNPRIPFLASLMRLNFDSERLLTRSQSGILESLIFEVKEFVDSDKSLYDMGLDEDDSNDVSESKTLMFYYESMEKRRTTFDLTFLNGNTKTYENYGALEFLKLVGKKGVKKTTYGLKSKHMFDDLTEESKNLLKSLAKNFLKRYPVYKLLVYLNVYFVLKEKYEALKIEPSDFNKAKEFEKHVDLDDFKTVLEDFDVKKASSNAGIRFDGREYELTAPIAKKDLDWFTKTLASHFSEKLIKRSKYYPSGYVEFAVEDPEGFLYGISLWTRRALGMTRAEMAGLPQIKKHFKGIDLVGSSTVVELNALDVASCRTRFGAFPRDPEMPPFKRRIRKEPTSLAEPNVSPPLDRFACFGKKKMFVDYRRSLTSFDAFAKSGITIKRMLESKKKETEEEYKKMAEAMYEKGTLVFKIEPHSDK